MERQIQYGGGITGLFTPCTADVCLPQSALNLKTYAATEALALGRRL